MSVKHLSLGKIAKGAGAVLLGLIAIDLVLTLVTVAVGAAVLRR